MRSYDTRPDNIQHPYSQLPSLYLWGPWLAMRTVCLMGPTWICHSQMLICEEPSYPIFVFLLKFEYGPFLYFFPNCLFSGLLSNFRDTENFLSHSRVHLITFVLLRCFISSLICFLVNRNC